MRLRTKQRVGSVAAATLIGIATVTTTGLAGAGTAGAQPSGSSDEFAAGSSYVTAVALNGLLRLLGFPSCEEVAIFPCWSEVQP